MPRVRCNMVALMGRLLSRRPPQVAGSAQLPPQLRSRWARQTPPPPPPPPPLPALPPLHTIGVDVGGVLLTLGTENAIEGAQRGLELLRRRAKVVIISKVFSYNKRRTIMSALGRLFNIDDGVHFVTCLTCVRCGRLLHRNGRLEVWVASCAVVEF